MPLTRSFREWLFLRRHMAACRKLQRMVDANRRAPATISYRNHRRAALKATRGT
jgi:hypothetical protein